MEYIDKIIQSRRSVRRYKNKPVEPDIIKQVLQAARWAPSWKNKQCWRFIVVQDSGIKTRISHTMGQNRSLQGILEAPVLIVLCAKTGESGYHNGVLATEKDSWYMFDSALCMQNMVLKAHTLGLGTVIVGLFDSSKVASIIKLPGDYEVVAMTPLGYPEEEPDAPERKTIQEITWSNLFGETFDHD